METEPVSMETAAVWQFLTVQRRLQKGGRSFFFRKFQKEERMEEKKREELESLYQDRLPKEIVEILTPEVRRQYFLWDEIMKRELQLYPWLILPVVKEIFHREYPADRNIVLLSTEYTVSRVYEKGEKLLQAIRSDILLKIARDLYHFECQIEKDGRMVCRMFEYDVNIALTHGTGIQRKRGRSGEFTLTFPKSAVLYLGNSADVPEYEICTLRFQDGTEHLYRVPVMRVQGYSLEEVKEKHLNMLIPFLVIRYRERIKEVSEKDSGDNVQNKETETERMEEREKLKKDLTGFISESLAVLEHEKGNGTLPESAGKDLGEFLWKACSYLLEENEELYREVSAEVEPAIKLSWEIEQENRELRYSNKELQHNNNELRKELENACKGMINEAVREGKSTEETVNMIIRVFSLTKEEAEERVKTSINALT